MIPLENLQKVKRLITHENCADGIASAMIIRMVLPQVEVLFCQYNSLVHTNLEPREGDLFCDFSPYLPKLKDDPTEAELRALEEAEKNLQRFVDAGAIVLDHHDTQRAVVAKFGERGVFADAATEPGVCGAVLAYRHVWLPFVQDMGSIAKFVDHEALLRIRMAVADFATVAGIQDTWQRKDPRFREALEQAEALKFWPPAILLQTSACADPPAEWKSRLALGPIVYERKETSAKKCIDNGWRFTAPGDLRVIVFEGLSRTSDAAEMLHEDVDLVVGFGYTCEKDEQGYQYPAIVFSTRSHTGFDCSVFAKAHGGGGHKAAAGFNQRLDVFGDKTPYAMIYKLVTDWQNKKIVA